MDINEFQTNLALYLASTSCSPAVSQPQWRRSPCRCCACMYVGEVRSAPLQAHGELHHVWGNWSPMILTLRLRPSRQHSRRHIRSRRTQRAQQAQHGQQRSRRSIRSWHNTCDKRCRRSMLCRHSMRSKRSSTVRSVVAASAACAAGITCPAGTVCPASAVGAAGAVGAERPQNDRGHLQWHYGAMSRQGSTEVPGQS